jgi:hypothetical protein
VDSSFDYAANFLPKSQEEVARLYHCNQSTITVPIEEGWPYLKRAQRLVALHHKVYHGRTGNLVQACAIVSPDRTVASPPTRYTKAY